ncbi:MAG: GatB/YqeY domain-containing protein [bacterium]|nr:GatB/YqeY domain-containing protein [bacterium]
MLLEKINKDYIEAKKSRDTLRESVLNLLKSNIKYKEIEAKSKGKTLEDNDIIDLIKQEIKKRKESIELYKQGGRQELVEKESAELEILQEYLPEQLSEEEIKTTLERIIGNVGAVSIKDFGKVMKEAMKDLKGKADGEVIRKIAENLLKEREKTTNG